MFWLHPSTYHTPPNWLPGVVRARTRNPSNGTADEGQSSIDSGLPPCRGGTQNTVSCTSGRLSEACTELNPEHSKLNL